MATVVLGALDSEAIGVSVRLYCGGRRAVAVGIAGTRLGGEALHLPRSSLGTPFTAVVRARDAEVGRGKLQLAEGKSVLQAGGSTVHIVVAPAADASAGAKGYALPPKPWEQLKAPLARAVVPETPAEALERALKVRYVVRAAIQDAVLAAEYSARAAAEERAANERAAAAASVELVSGAISALIRREQADADASAAASRIVSDAAATGPKRVGSSAEEALPWTIATVALGTLLLYLYDLIRDVFQS